MNDSKIIGTRSNKSDIYAFCAKKMLLQEQDYPIAETKALVNEYFDKVKERLTDTMDSKTLLIKVPSGSGSNKITHLLAKKMEDTTGASVLPETMIRKLHKGEAKKQLTLGKRNEDPIRYNIDISRIKKNIHNYNKIVIVDDVIASGESSIRLKKALESEGIKVDAMASLITIENRHPKLADMLRFYNKIDAQLNLPHAEKSKLREDIYTVFGDYTKAKLNRVERYMLDKKSALSAYANISKAAGIETQLKKTLKKSLSV